MRGALKKRLVSQQTPTTTGANEDRRVPRDERILKQKKLQTPDTETSSSIEKPRSFYEMPTKTDGWETPSLFSPLQRNFQGPAQQQLWLPTVTSGEAYDFGQQDVTWNGYMPASCYNTAPGMPF